MGDLYATGNRRSPTGRLRSTHLYDLAEIERNHEAYANERAVVASSLVKRTLAERPVAPGGAGAAGAGED